jgi:hypothetical protein
MTEPLQLWRPPGALGLSKDLQEGVLFLTYSTLTSQVHWPLSSAAACYTHSPLSSAAACCAHWQTGRSAGATAAHARHRWRCTAADVA